MGEFRALGVGAVGLIQQQEDGSIIQIGLNEEQSEQLQQFLAILSQESPLINMGKDYELVFKNNEDESSRQELLFS